MITAKIIADSIGDYSKRITTLQIKFHRFILPEFNTHRVFSRNFSSSRAIPTEKLLAQVRTDPAMPVHWGKNQPGMQASHEMDPKDIEQAKMEWRMSAMDAAANARTLSNIGAHKQIVNRILEPYLWVTGIVTSTEWDNWFELRDHPDAQPEIHELALRMREAMDGSTPALLKEDEWHLPYLTADEVFKYGNDLSCKVSAARCCRVSYLNHDGSNPDVDKDLALFERLAGSVPLHASPLEHQATPLRMLARHSMRAQGNFQEWIQYRKVWEKEIYNTPTKG